MHIMELVIRDLSKLTTQLIFTLDQYRVKRDLSAQDVDSAEDEIDCSSLGFLPGGC